MNTTLELSEIDVKIGQLFMAGIPGTSLDEGTEALIRDYDLGGVILFSRNIADPVQLATLCRDLQNSAMSHHGHLLFLAVDQEGGRVARLRGLFREFPGSSAIGKSKNPLEKALEFGTVTAREMKIVGLNMNLAPVIDVEMGKLEKHLEGRVFGKDPQVVAMLGRAVVKSLQENGVMAVAKHFPGLGLASVDPHFHALRIEAGLKDIENINLPPFRAVIEEGVSGIMSSHAVYPALDPQHPATLSRSIISGLLRENMGFEGLIITDDLEMGAISNRWSVAEGAAKALEAGADILLICKDQKNVTQSIDIVRSKLLKGEIPFKRLEESTQRILHARSRFLDPGEEISLEKVREYFKV
ncbi:MAG: beta-N-acetylhexosaminidase [Deltaproteobacteria bacterium]|nr:beta-N-acetylhexosaminidase [Deltaproteobacteria bacterium]MBW2301462.1 beta-N-acetylhexosaminidase [Deltaproteobacteria bacterium]